MATDSLSSLDLLKKKRRKKEERKKRKMKKKKEKEKGKKEVRKKLQTFFLKQSPVPKFLTKKSIELN